MGGNEPTKAISPTRATQPAGRRGPAPFPVSTRHVDPAFGLGKKGHPGGQAGIAEGR